MLNRRIFFLVVALAIVALASSVWAGGSTVKGKVKIGKTTFEYSEKKYGTSGAGNRGIEIWRQGVKGDKNSYKFDPNPHENSKKYPKKAEAFYSAAAEKIGQYVAANNNQYPRPGSLKFNWEGEQYTCGNP